MNIKRIHISSVVLTLLSFLLELALNKGWLPVKLNDIAFGVSLGFILIAMGLNVKVIRSMTIPDQSKKGSQLILLLITGYAFLIYGLEII